MIEPADFAVEMAMGLVNDFRGERPRPPGTYVCHRCHARGEHYIRDCPVVRSRMGRPMNMALKKLTSSSTAYQGESRSIGKFKCPQCHHQWYDLECYARPRRDCIRRVCRARNIAPVKMVIDAVLVRTALQYGQVYALRQGLVRRDTGGHLRLVDAHLARP